jgi:hypothetical protein
VGWGERKVDRKEERTREGQTDVCMYILYTNNLLKEGFRYEWLWRNHRKNKKIKKKIKHRPQLE